MAARKTRNRHRRRRGRFGFLYKLLSFLVILAAILVGCVAFFRVNQITVEGNSRYSAQEIIQASGVELGENLLLISKPQTAGSIQKQLPYVQNVFVVRRPPDGLTLRVTESTVAAVIQAGDAWWLMDARGKLLDWGDESVKGTLPVVSGIHPTEPGLGDWLTVEPEERLKLESLEGLLTALANRGMVGNVTGFVDLNAANTIYFGFGDNLTVAVPMSGDFDRWAFQLQRVLETFQQRGGSVTGTLDLTYGDEQARLLTERWLPGRDEEGEEAEHDGAGTDGQPVDEQREPDSPAAGE